MMTPTTVEHTLTLAAVLPTLIVAHNVADYWIQTNGQAVAKGAAGWRGRLADARHVATYTATLAVALLAVVWTTGLSLLVAQTAGALAVNAVSHYWADRRTTLAGLARRVGKAGWLEADPGALPHLDQAWHLGWLGITALIVAS